MCSAFDFLVNNKKVLKGAEKLLLRSTRVTKTRQIPGKSSTESLHQAWNNAWEGERSAHASKELMSEGLQIKPSSLKRIRQIEDMEWWKYVAYAWSGKGVGEVGKVYHFIKTEAV